MVLKSRPCQMYAEAKKIHKKSNTLSLVVGICGKDSIPLCRFFLKFVRLTSLNYRLFLLFSSNSLHSAWSTSQLYSKPHNVYDLSNLPVCLIRPYRLRLWSYGWWYYTNNHDKGCKENNASACFGYKLVKKGNNWKIIFLFALTKQVFM